MIPVLPAFFMHSSKLNSFVASLILFAVLCHTKANAQLSYAPATTLPGMELNITGAGIVQTPDINNDGLPDIIYINPATTTLVYLQNNGGSFAAPAVNPFSAFQSTVPTGLTFTPNTSIADFDGDGDLDIWARITGANNDIYIANNNGVYAVTTILPGMEYQTNVGLNLVQVADINKDGLPDILYTTGNAGPLIYLQNNAGNSFSTPQVNPFAAYASGTPAGFNFSATTSIADFDGDGDLDIWQRLSGAGNDAYLQNNAGIFGTSAPLPGMEYAGSTGGLVQVADMNDDGLNDIIYISTTGGVIYLQNNNGSSFSVPSINPFTAYTTTAPAYFNFSTSASVADFDGDGDLDVWCRVNGANNDLYMAASGGAPYLVSSTPARGATAVGLATNIVLTFSEQVYTGAGNIYLHRLDNDSVIKTIAANGSQVTGSGTNTITIDTIVELAPATAYYITTDRLALADADGILVGGIDAYMRLRLPVTTNNFLSFKTVGTLAINLLSFTAVQAGADCLLQWHGLEDDTKQVVVQYSNNGINWRNIGMMVARTPGYKSSFVDTATCTGNNYYRLALTMNNGNTLFSEVRHIKIQGSVQLSLYPNPTHEVLKISYAAPMGNSIIIISNVAGVTLIQHKKNLTTNNAIDVSGLVAGLYFITVTNGKTSWQSRFIKQ